LTVLGVLIGVTAIVALIAIGTGVSTSLLADFRTIGFDVLLLVPRAGFTETNSLQSPTESVRGGGEQAVESLSLSPSLPSEFVTTDESEGGEDAPPSGYLAAGAVVSEIPSVAAVGLIETAVRLTQAGKHTGMLRVTALSAGAATGFSGLLGGFVVEQGRLADPSASEREAVLGASTASRTGVSVGEEVTIDGMRFRVVGTLAPSSVNTSGAWLGAREAGRSSVVTTWATQEGMEVFRALANTDNGVFVPYDVSREIWPVEQMSTVVAVRVRPGISMSETVATIKQTLEGTGVQMEPLSTQELADNVQRALGMVRIVLASVAGIALVVGSVGMMNTMYTSVLERTREIGILKAVGAKDRQVLALFLIDSGIMGLLGGLLGLAAGVGISFAGTSIVARMLGVAPFSPVFSPGLVLGALAFSSMLGALAGAWPARHAAKLDPVRALASR
jgi:putative ABC transport system permease protein